MGLHQPRIRHRELRQDIHFNTLRHETQHEGSKKEGTNRLDSQLPGHKRPKTCTMGHRELRHQQQNGCHTRPQRQQESYQHDQQWLVCPTNGPRTTTTPHMRTARITGLDQLQEIPDRMPATTKRNSTRPYNKPAEGHRRCQRLRNP